MSTTDKTLVELALQHGADKASVVDISRVPFKEEFRLACEQNTCGNYKTSWTCPPGVGDINELIADAKTYSKALVFQSIGQLEDSFDIEGMEESEQRHQKIMRTLCDEFAQILPADTLRLGSGQCLICEKCTYPDSPCRYPDKAITSVSSYGIAVSELAPACGMNYINGQNTVTYFSVFIYKQ